MSWHLRIGARGGRACGDHRREDKPLLLTPHEATPLPLTGRRPVPESSSERPPAKAMSRPQNCTTPAPAQEASFLRPMGGSRWSRRALEPARFAGRRTGAGRYRGAVKCDEPVAATEIPHAHAVISPAPRRCPCLVTRNPCGGSNVPCPSPACSPEREDTAWPTTSTRAGSMRTSHRREDPGRMRAPHDRRRATAAVARRLTHGPDGKNSRYPAGTGHRGRPCGRGPRRRTPGPSRHLLPGRR